ncbi:hypothetical protein HMI54_007771 [Coelomomyces lativittatus]|nr:hypothetical protein HMI56_003567 [Coelomomyces lativittatus]KAJ1516288.1 hypothetical protein HMI55_002608 [Coelomomyces lativittatus]KAJ1516911.1 hypothetical protein HMI54_007771 [Coelomomyces lativittatus]
MQTKPLDYVSDTSQKKIKYIQFGVHSKDQIENVAEVELWAKEFYKFNDGSRSAAEHGALDLRLGPSEKSSTCSTCNMKLAECSGHFGYIRLSLPLFHVGFFKAIVTILQNICKTCSRVMLTEKDRRQFLKRLRVPHLDNVQRQRILKAINVQCRKFLYCPYCSSSNGTVKKVGPLKVIHDRYRDKRLKDELEAFKHNFQSAIDHIPELSTYLSKTPEDLHPLRVLRLFLNINDNDVELLGMNPDFGRPEDYLWTYFPVPPACIRPSVVMDAQTSNEDDLTLKIGEILYTNALIQKNLNDGQPLSSIMEQWDFLQLTAGLYINSEMPGIPLAMASSKGARGFSQRLKGKQGRFRGNLSGKRVDFSARTVISPDPNMRIDQVAVPERVAKILTYPERVTTMNLKRLRKVVQNGPEHYPGANYLVEAKTNLKRFLKFGDRKQLASCLKVGDIVERHLQDDDIVLFNRQPSLHKLSIMSHRAKVKTWRTFRFNECVCTPYNADFDGDEMNLHLPQTEEARAEAALLMDVKQNLVTPRNGEPIIAATQDFITASYLISSKDTFFTLGQFSQCIAHMWDGPFELPLPSILKPVKLWTGKQVLSCLLRPHQSSPVCVNLETKTRSYVRRSQPDLCPSDGWLVIRNSEVMCGVWDKSIIGDGNKESVFYVVLRDYGCIEAAMAMNRLARLCARWLGNHGFSVGIQDVQPGSVLMSRKEALVMTGYNDCDDLIAQSKKGQLENQPGLNLDQSLESHISRVLSKIRDDAGAICMQELNKYNAPLIMSVCGSKGSKINVCQMVACVGQQIISGSRIPDGFEDRSLPHFPKNSKLPAAKGFVRNSFYTGLTPTEFFFHAVSGREGLVDTAVKTAETGYMQRRLMKALEDLTVHYDYTVRQSAGEGIIQFVYGDDGLDPTNIEGDHQPVEFKRNLMHSINLHPPQNGTDFTSSLSPQDILEYSEQETKKWSLCSNRYIEALHEFIRSQVCEPLKQLGATYPSDHANKLFHITLPQLDSFLKCCERKYIKAKIEPGTAAGAIGAQSIGEPGTQMTLKTFHFAGVASMNVTMGVPRIKEIINASKTILTPIITAKLVSEHSEPAARIVKGRIEKTNLGDVLEHMDITFAATGCYLDLRIDLNVIDQLQLEIDVYTIVHSILINKPLKLQSNQVFPLSKFEIRVTANTLQIAYRYRQMLPKVLIAGFSTTHRVVISENSGRFELGVEGLGLRNVMNTVGVVGTETTSNHIIEMQSVLGIEAARNTIIYEIQNTMSKHGMTIDPRHVMLLGDIMTFKGEILGITRFGVSKMKDSVLMLASFEKTIDHLFDASMYAKKDPIQGVSECIIMGIPMSIGSGIFQIAQANPASDSELKSKKKPRLLFDRTEFHPSLNITKPSILSPA